MQKMMTAGTFAKQCNTTKATLRWYREMGLLVPAHIGANGYAYYAVEQLVTFNIIRALQNIGYSLTEIKADSWAKRSQDTDFLNEKIGQLDDRIAELHKQRQFLQELLDHQNQPTQRWGNQLVAGAHQIRDLAATSYLVMPAPTIDTAVYQLRLASFQQLCGKLGLGTDAPIVTYIDAAHLRTGSYAAGFEVATAVTDVAGIQKQLNRLKSTDAQVITRPASEYFTYLMAMPLQRPVNADPDVSLPNPMIAGQRAAVEAGQQAGAVLDSGMVATPLTVQQQPDGGKRLFYEISLIMPTR